MRTTYDPDKPSQSSATWRRDRSKAKRNPSQRTRRLLVASLEDRRLLTAINNGDIRGGAGHDLVFAGLGDALKGNKNRMQTA